MSIRFSLSYLPLQSKGCSLEWWCLKSSASPLLAQLFRFRHRLKKTSKLRVTSLCTENSPMSNDFPAQKTSNAENVSIWWRHHTIAYNTILCIDHCRRQRLMNVTVYFYRWYQTIATIGQLDNWTIALFLDIRICSSQKHHVVYFPRMLLLSELGIKHELSSLKARLHMWHVDHYSLFTVSRFIYHPCLEEHSM